MKTHEPRNSTNKPPQRVALGHIIFYVATDCQPFLKTYLSQARSVLKRPDSPFSTYADFESKFSEIVLETLERKDEPLEVEDVKVAGDAIGIPYKEPENKSQSGFLNSLMSLML